MPSPGIVASGAVITPGFRSSLGNAGVASNGATMVISSQLITIGDLVVVRIATDNLSATTPTFTCTDSAGNTYTTVAQAAVNATAAAGVSAAILVSKATSNMEIGGNITITQSGSVSARCCYAESYQGFSATLRNAAVTATGAGTASTVTSGSASIGDLVIGCVGIESRAAPTYDSDTAGGAWSAGFVKPNAASGTDTNCVEAAGQYKVVNAAGTQTYNLTNANTDWVALIAIFTPG